MKRDLLSSHPGGHRTNKKGESLEFSGYRVYTPGDDPRHIDWKAYSRSDKYYIREFEGESRGNLMLILDRSPSMMIEGNWNLSKFGFTLSSALAAAALSSGDVVYLPPFRRFVGLKSLQLFDETLKNITADPSWDIERFCIDSTASLQLPAKVLLISDFLYPLEESCFPIFKYFAKRNFDVCVLHLHKPLPAESNIIEVVDAESGKIEALDLSSSKRAEYTSLFDSHCAQLEEESRRYGFSYSKISVETSIEEVIFYQLRKDGVLL